MTKLYASELALDQYVIYVLSHHRGKGQTIERWELVAEVYGDESAEESVRNNNNRWDRAVRESIERWRSQGQHVCSQGGGYYLAESREEYEDWKKTYLKPAYRLFENVKMLDETADKRWGKMPKDEPLPLFAPPPAPPQIREIAEFREGGAQ